MRHKTKNVKHMSKIIAIANNKGGVGKTTTVMAMGYSWAEQGHRILFVDLDSQANLTSSLMPEEFDPERTIADAFQEKLDIPVVKVSDNIDLVPSGLSLSNFDNITSRYSSREFLLADLLEPVKDRYDFILIDCPPALGLITYNAFVAADHLIMTTTAEKYSYDGMMMISQIYNDVRSSNRLNPGLALTGVVITLFRKSKVSDLWLDKIREEVGDRFIEPVVRAATKVQQAATFSRSIFEYDPQGAASRDYKLVADELYRRITSQRK